MSDWKQVVRDEVVLFGHTVRAEWTKIWRRGFGRAGLVIALAHGVLCFLIMFAIYAVGRWGPFAAQGGGEFDVFDGLMAGEWTLFSLFLPVMGIVLMAVVGELYGGEYAQRTYSLLLIRPVPRYKVFLSKFIAAYGYVLFIIALTSLIATVLGLAAFGLSRDFGGGDPLLTGLIEEPGFGQRLGQYCVTFVAISYTMLPILALTALMAVVTRSTALTVTYVIILMVIDGGIWLTFPWVTQALDYEIFEQLKPYTILATRLFWWDMFFAPEPMVLKEFFSESWKALLLSLGYSAAAIGAAIGVFTVQDVE